MSEKRSFEVYLITKVPFLSKFLWSTLLILALIIFLITLPLQLFSDYPREIKALYFMVLVPSFIKTILFYSCGLFVLVSGLYYNLKIKVKGFVVLGERSISLISKRMTFEMDTDKILKVYVFDPMNRHQIPKEKLELYFYLYKQVVKRVRLSDYSQSDLLVAKLFKYEQVKFEVFTESILPDNFE